MLRLLRRLHKSSRSYENTKANRLVVEKELENLAKAN
jgi:hypothetical protein